MTARVSRDHLYVADELFVCGTAAEIVGIAEVDGRRVGIGRTGPITTRLQQAYAEAVHGRTCTVGRLARVRRFEGREVAEPLIYCTLPMSFGQSLSSWASLFCWRRQ